MNDMFYYNDCLFHIGDKILVSYEGSVKVEAEIKFGEYHYDDEGYEVHNIGIFVEYFANNHTEILGFCDFIDYIEAWSLDYIVSHVNCEIL